MKTAEIKKETGRTIIPHDFLDLTAYRAAITPLPLALINKPVQFVVMVGPQIAVLTPDNR